ncbi:MAG: glycosyltransferase family 2 protein [bacterium]
MKLSIIIVSYKVREKLRENLQALFASVCDFNFEVFVIDNNSQDGTVEMVREEYPRVKLIANSQNTGFAYANNQVLKEVEGEYVLLLNPDMKVQPNTLQNMVDWMDNSSAGIASCKLFNDRGELIRHVRRFPKFSDQLAIALKLPHLFPNILDKYILQDFDYDLAQEVDSVRGGFMMIRESVLKTLGIFDERFFLWFEEVDYCRRAKEKNIQVWYTPRAECLDYVGQSFKQVPTGITQKYFQNSMIAYFKKWHSPSHLILALAWSIGRLMSWAGELVGFQKRNRS